MINNKKNNPFDIDLDDLENQIDGLTWVNDPEWSHECAKEILSTLSIPYSALKMYDIVRILLKYQK